MGGNVYRQCSAVPQPYKIGFINILEHFGVGPYGHVGETDYLHRVVARRQIVEHEQVLPKADLLAVVWIEGSEQMATT